MPAAPDHRPTTSRLPPPPAPVARDANPWQISGRAAKPARSRADPRALATHPVPPAPAPPQTTRHGLARFVPIAIFLAVVGSIASGALEALGRGDRFGAFIPLVVIGVAALSLWRSARRARRRRAPGTPGGTSSDR